MLRKATHGISDVYIRGGLAREKWDWRSPSHSNRRQPIESTASSAGLPSLGDDVIRQTLRTLACFIKCGLRGSLTLRLCPPSDIHMSAYQNKVRCRQVHHSSQQIRKENN